MKNLSLLFIIAINYFLVACGGNNIENSLQKISKIIDPNTIELQNGLRINLIGIDDNANSKDEISKWIGKDVVIVQDSKNYKSIDSSIDEINAYVKDASNQESLNATLLKKSKSNLNEKYLADSLMIFQSYASKKEKDGFGQLIKDDSKDDTEESDNAINPNQKYSLEDLVEKNSEAVFTIHASNVEGERSLGSGFFISETEGLTNLHVVKDADIAFIRMKDGAFYQIKKILKYNEYYDYAKFKIESKNKRFPYLKLSKKTPKSGSDIFVIGSPRGLEQTTTKGIVSAIRPDKNEYDDETIIQIDAPISPGNSGGPVMNMKGEVIGIATSKRLDADNIGFAVNIINIMKHIDEVK